jgi:hypothetical protein
MVIGLYLIRREASDGMWRSAYNAYYQISSAYRAIHNYSHRNAFCKAGTEFQTIRKK